MMVVMSTKPREPGTNRPSSGLPGVNRPASGLPAASAGTARRTLALFALGAIVAAVVTLVVSGGFGQGTSLATEAGPAAVAAKDSSFGSAEPGECLQWTPTDDPNTDRQDLTTVACAQPHRFEVASNVDLSMFPGAEFGPTAAYPDGARFASLRDEHCVSAVEEYMSGRFDPTGKYSVGLMYPSQMGWADGERSIRCGIQQSGATSALQTMVGGVADQDQSTVWDAGTCVGIAAGVPTDPVDCSEPHAFEVVSVVDLTPQFPNGLPSVDDQDKYLEQTCTTAANDYLGDPDALRNKTLTLFWDNVDASSWFANSRRVSCSIGKEVESGGFSTIVGSASGDITIDGAAPVAPPPLADGRRLPTPLPGAAPFQNGN
ncbi:hypothetical protein GCM10007304_00560 [Rhodococcoides trifolii]|uniref:Septum formation-related domain-containing protein n=2 Tax=Rhodococcoides trifolii TaxID=908250 RepID=A0A917FL89_9NOCA|nr:hypothetical protein GCM10007304_00560 [Rhodococcus trifolii]